MVSYRDRFRSMAAHNLNPPLAYNQATKPSNGTRRNWHHGMRRSWEKIGCPSHIYIGIRKDVAIDQLFPDASILSQPHICPSGLLEQLVLTKAARQEDYTMHAHQYKAIGYRWPGTQLKKDFLLALAWQ